MQTPENVIVEQWKDERAPLERRKESLQAAVKRAADELEALEDIVSCHWDVFSTSDMRTANSGVFQAIELCSEHLGDCADQLTRMRAELDECDEKYARLLRLTQADAKDDRSSCNTEEG